MDDSRLHHHLLASLHHPRLTLRSTRRVRTRSLGRPLPRVHLLLLLLERELTAGSARGGPSSSWHLLELLRSQRLLVMLERMLTWRSTLVRGRQGGLTLVGVLHGSGAAWLLLLRRAAGRVAGLRGQARWWRGSGLWTMCGLGEVGEMLL